MKNDKSIDELLHTLSNTQKVIPSDSFIDKVESKALGFAALKAKYGKQTMIAICAILAIFFAINLWTIYQSETTTGTNENVQTEYNTVPVNTIDYE